MQKDQNWMDTKDSLKYVYELSKEKLKKVNMMINNESCQNPAHLNNEACSFKNSMGLVER
jgi:hypothetical protein